MVRLTFFLLISWQVFAQEDAMKSLLGEYQTLTKQLSDQAARTKIQEEKYIKAQKELREYQGSNPTTKKFLEETLAVAKDNLEFAQRGEAEFRSMIRFNEAEREELGNFHELKRFTNCDAHTPEINLEKETPYMGATFKGAFHHIPRDNQDGVGTCFANTAKNLLVGLSAGNDVASFLDMALQYQTDDKLLSEALDGGDSCKTLMKIQENGFCPQSLAPMEMGERNYFTEGLFHHDPLTDLSANIDLLKSFFINVEKLKYSFPENQAEILLKAKPIIERIKSNPGIKIPLPVVRFSIPGDSELYRIHQERKIAVPFQDFLTEYMDAYKKFYPVMIKSLLEGKKPKKIFDQYKTTLKSFLDKYSLNSELKKMRERFLILADTDLENPNFKTHFRESLQFMKELSHQGHLSDEAFADYCGEEGSEVLGLLNSLSPIVSKLQSEELNPDALFDKNGELKNIRDLMQLTVAPSCLSSQNRKKLDYPVVCKSGYDTVRNIKNSKLPSHEKVLRMRDKVVMSLSQGLPLGNIFPVTESTSHINTIVGLRFNSENQQCEYLIRESQTGTSGWQSEKGLFEKMSGLTEVRRR